MKLFEGTTYTVAFSRLVWKSVFAVRSLVARIGKYNALYMFFLYLTRLRGEGDFYPLMKVVLVIFPKIGHFKFLLPFLLWFLLKWFLTHKIHLDNNLAIQFLSWKVVCPITWQYSLISTFFCAGKWETFHTNYLCSNGYIENTYLIFLIQFYSLVLNYLLWHRKMRDLFWIVFALNYN